MSDTKRRRLDLDSDTSPGLVNEMKSVCKEVEPFTMCRPGHGDFTCYRPTYKAVLAHRGYLVRQTLGSGTYSKVKMALNLNVDRSAPEKVAIKIIDRHKAPNDYQNKFLPREMAIWPRLKHPHIMHLREIFQDMRRVYMVLDFAPGGDALSFVQKNGPQPECRARRWIFQLAGAVHYLHSLGVTHRDLKLENLLIDKKGDIKLCDFGFIKGGCTGMSALSSTYCGSKSYAAPEILQGRPYDPCKTDVWAVGVVTYILLTGRMPFDETRGTESVLKEQRALTFHWRGRHPLSADCRQVVLGMFTWDFVIRPTISDVLANPWFTDVNSDHALLTPMDTDVLPSQARSDQSANSKDITATPGS